MSKTHEFSLFIFIDGILDNAVVIGEELDHVSRRLDNDFILLLAEVLRAKDDPRNELRMSTSWCSGSCRAHGCTGCVPF